MNKCNFCEYTHAHEVGLHNDLSDLYADGCTSSMCRRAIETMVMYGRVSAPDIRKEVNINRNYKRN